MPRNRRQLPAQPVGRSIGVEQRFDPTVVMLDNPLGEVLKRRDQKRRGRDALLRAARRGSRARRPRPVARARAARLRSSASSAAAVRAAAELAVEQHADHRLEGTLLARPRPGARPKCSTRARQTVGKASSRVGMSRSIPRGTGIPAARQKAVRLLEQSRPVGRPLGAAARRPAHACFDFASAAA